MKTFKEFCSTLNESAAKFNTKVGQAERAATSGNHKNAKMHLDNASSYLYSVPSTDMSKIQASYDAYKQLRKKYNGTGGDYQIKDNMSGVGKLVKEDNETCTKLEESGVVLHRLNSDGSESSAPTAVVNLPDEQSAEKHVQDIRNKNLGKKIVYNKYVNGILTGKM